MSDTGSSLTNHLAALSVNTKLRLQFAGNKAKGRISKRVFQESKACQNFRKTNISYPLIRTPVETLVLRFALLPYYRRVSNAKQDTSAPSKVSRFSTYTYSSRFSTQMKSVANVIKSKPFLTRWQIHRLYDS